MNTFTAVVLLSLTFGVCNSANVKNATLTTLPEAVADVSYKNLIMIFLAVLFVWYL